MRLLNSVAFATLTADPEEHRGLEECRLAIADHYHDRICALEARLFDLMPPAAKAVYDELDRVRWERGAELTGATFCLGRRPEVMAVRILEHAERMKKKAGVGGGG